MKAFRVTMIIGVTALTFGCASYKADVAGIAEDNCISAKTADNLIKYCDAAIATGRVQGYRADLVYNSRGLGHLMKSEYDLALADFERAIVEKPTEVVYYVNRGDAYLGLKEYDRAIAGYDRAIAEYPRAKELYIHRGVAYLWKRDGSKAFANFDRAVELTGNGDAGALVFHAIGAFTLQDYPTASKDLRKALDLKPGAMVAEDGLCRSLAHEGRVIEAMTHCERALEVNEMERVGPLFVRGYGKLRSGDWRAALSGCDAPVGLIPASAAALYCSAYAHERLGEMEAAKTEYAAARAVDSKADAAMRRLGIVPGEPTVKLAP